MILHLVLIRFKPGVSSDRIASAGRALLAMKGVIPDIQDVRWNPNLGPSAQEYSHVLSVSVQDLAALNRYLEHPEHRRTIADHLQDIREARLALDIET